jgi:hypothetical protein
MSRLVKDLFELGDGYDRIFDPEWEPPLSLGRKSADRWLEAGRRTAGITFATTPALQAEVNEAVAKMGIARSVFVHLLVQYAVKHIQKRYGSDYKVAFDVLFRHRRRKAKKI